MNINKANFMDLIHKEYNTIKSKFINCCRKRTVDFNEDVFHDTIINCYNRICECDMQFEYSGFISYLYKAFKTNLLRETQYFHNKNREGISKENEHHVFKPHHGTENDVLTSVDRSILLDKIKGKYGELFHKLYDEIIEGVPISNLLKKYNIKNLKNKLKKISPSLRYL